MRRGIPASKLLPPTAPSRFQRWCARCPESEIARRNLHAQDRASRRNLWLAKQATSSRPSSPGGEEAWKPILR